MRKVLVVAFGLTLGGCGAQASSGGDGTSPTVGLMKWIPAGTFTMGSPASESDHEPDEVQHTVTLTRGFLLMEHEVTRGEWEAVMGGNPSSVTSCGSRCPVAEVTWFEAVAFANALSKKEGLTPAYSVSGESVSANAGASGYRLPTEAEWEWAAKGGEEYEYAGSSDVDAVAWYIENSEVTTHPVCGKQRNGYGLCDMSGNVWEWVWDCYGDYPTSAAPDPSGPRTAPLRVYRGGSWFNGASGARVANRFAGAPSDPLGNLGFRLARSVPAVDIVSKPAIPAEQRPTPPAENPPPARPAPPPYDCLAGVCIGMRSGVVADSVVTVAQEKWLRLVDVCSGVVTAVTIGHTWYQTGFPIVGPSETATPVFDGDGTRAGDVVRRVTDIMADKGWYVDTSLDDGASFANLSVTGKRGVYFRRMGDYANAWAVVVASVHPDYATLCAERNGAGL